MEFINKVMFHRHISAGLLSIGSGGFGSRVRGLGSEALPS
jgi:hypothetical protein